jgi:hypothetical protein
MALGGGVVAAATRRASASSATCSSRPSNSGRRLRQRHSLASQQLREVQKRVELGIERRESVSDAQFKTHEAEAAVRSIELDIAEIQATSREPVHALTAR